MLNSHWPSFYGNLIDYYLSPWRRLLRRKKGLRPLSVAFDSYATGDNSQAKITVFDQTPGDVGGLRSSRPRLRPWRQAARRPFRGRHRGSFQRRERRS